MYEDRRSRTRTKGLRQKQDKAERLKRLQDSAELQENVELKDLKFARTFLIPAEINFVSMQSFAKKENSISHKFVKQDVERKKFVAKKKARS
jgi:hypothetical protein